MRRAVFLLALLASGCVTRPTGEVAGGEAHLARENVLYIECDRARVTVPESRKSEFVWDFTEGRCVGVSLPGLVVRTREEPPDCEFAGEDLSVIAEGGVRTRTSEGRLSLDEGPFQTLILRNGKVLKR